MPIIHSMQRCINNLNLRIIYVKFNINGALLKIGWEFGVKGFHFNPNSLRYSEFWCLKNNKSACGVIRDFDFLVVILELFGFYFNLYSRLLR